MNIIGRGSKITYDKQLMKHIVILQSMFASDE